MRRNGLRFGVAVLCSALCYGATLWIYDYTAPPNLVGDRQPIAFVIRVDNEVERRPLKRTIWQGLENSDPVYPGEAIRTARTGQAKLQFQGNAKTLDIEPDSLIVLSADKGNISLELLDGSVFVAQTEGAVDEGTQKLTLKSESGNVDLSNATAALSKSANKAVDLQVIKGSATLKNGETTQSLKAGDVSALTSDGARTELAMIKVVSPVSDLPQYISMQKPQPLQFKWEEAPENSTMELWLGSSRKDMKRVTDTRRGDSQTLLSSIGTGLHFWKFVARPSDDPKRQLAESPVQRLEVLALAPPPIVQPGHNEFITLQSDGLPITFQWSTPDRVSEVTLEIASDEAFRKLLFTEKFPAKVTQADRILPSGKYYWRVSAFYSEEREMISAQPQSFEVWVKPPKVISIAWTIEKTMFYPVEPKAELTWTATEDPEIKKWRVRVAPTEADLGGEPSEKTLLFEVTDKKVASPLPGPGRWIASIEALDSEGRVISKGENRSFDLEVIPAIPAPVLLPEQGDLRADNRGDLTLKWRGPAGVKSYEVKLKAEDGREIASKTLTQSTTELENLLPGKYSVEVRATDQYGRPSEPAKVRRLIVPDGSGLSAPKVKRIQVD